MTTTLLKILTAVLVPLIAASLPPAAWGSPDDMADAALVRSIVTQARDAADRYKAGQPPDTIVPPAGLGPATGNRQFPFGWRVHDRNGLYASLYDVHEAVVRRFNRVLYGEAKSFNFGGANGPAAGRPYGGFAVDSKHWIIVPLAWLDTDEAHRLGTAAELGTGAEQSATPREIAVGMPARVEELEAHGVPRLDDVLALSLLYSATDMRAVHGATDNLARRLTEVRSQSAAHTRLIDNARRCADTRETFARKDCVDALIAEVEALGRSAASSKRLAVNAGVSTRWDEQGRRLLSRVQGLDIGTIGPGGCEPSRLCVAVGPYNSFGLQNMVCWRLDAPLPQQLTFPMTEAEARELSQRSGDLAAIGSATFIYSVTEPLKVLPQPRMCGASKNKVVAEGAAMRSADLLWNRQALQFVRAVQPKEAPMSVTGKSAKATAMPMLKATPDDTKRSPQHPRVTIGTQ